MKGKKRIVYLPDQLYGKIEQRIPNTEFRSVDGYVAFVLEEVLKEVEEEGKIYSKEEEEEVKKRLRELGYLD